MSIPYSPETVTMLPYMTRVYMQLRLSILRWGDYTDYLLGPTTISWVLKSRRGKRKSGSDECDMRRTWPAFAGFDSGGRVSWAKKCNESRNWNLSLVYSQQKNADLKSFNCKTLNSANNWISKETKSPLELSVRKAVLLIPWLYLKETQVWLPT